MDVLTNFRQRLTQNWESWSSAQRSFFVGSICVIAAFVAGLGYWFTQPAYVRLASDLTPVSAAEITTALESANIDYELSLMGSSVMVSRDDLARARGVLANTMADNLDSGSSGMGSFGMRSDGDDQTRTLEIRIANTLTQISAIHSATVNIGRPDPSPWIRDNVQTTASVLVTARPGHEITSKDAAAIVDIVARGVNNLEPANISVVDSNGRRLNTSGDLHGDIGVQQDYTYRIENALAAKAENVLRPLLGPNNVVVVVTAEVDFDKLERTLSRPDAETRVPLTEEITNRTFQGIGLGSGRPVGTDANLPSTSPSSAMQNFSETSPVKEETETTITTYAESNTVERIIEAPGAITRLSVSALVDLSDAIADLGEGATAPSQDDIRKQIEAAVGFDTARNDTIQLTVGRIIKPAEVETPIVAASFWSQHVELLHNVALGIVGLSALLLGWMILRRVSTPVIVKEPSVDEVSNAARRLSLLNSQVRDDPELIAKIMSNWLGAEDADEATNAAAASSTRGRRAA